MDRKRILNGVLASVAGGIVFGLMMQMMGMMKMIAMMVGSESAGVGWIVHLVISALFGVFYTFLFHSFSRQWLGGLIYGFIWYLLGPLTLMPLFMGMGLQWSAAAIAGSMSSLVGHLVYGVVLGLVYGKLEQAKVQAETPGAQTAMR